MEVELTPAAAEEGVLRVWLRRIPEQSGVVYAFRKSGLGTDDTSDKEPAGEAYLYGRGKDSEAREKVMLMFRLRRDQKMGAFRPGEKVDLKVRSLEGEALLDVELDILEIE